MHPELIILDFDNTFVRGETLDVLAEIALQKHPEYESRVQQIAELTRQGMEGSLPFGEALRKRLELLDAHRSDLNEVTERMKRQVSPSIARNRRFLEQHRDQIFIVSSGFREVIQPVVSQYGIHADHIYANSFLFDYAGHIVGCDLANPLSQDSGKVAVLKQLQLSGRVVVIGDGYTDMELRDKGDASAFYAFTEHVHRDSVADAADEVLADFDSYLKLHGIVSQQAKQQGKKVLLLENIHPLAVQQLEALGLDVELLPGALAENELIDKVKDAVILGIRSKTKVSKRVLESAPELLAVGAFCIGTNQIDLPACSEHGVAVFNAPYSNTRSVVELALGEIIMLHRQTFDRSRALHSGQWQKTAVGSHEIRGKTLGIIGYGNIGSQLSILAEALGMNVYFYDLEEKLPLGNARPCSSLRELLERSDVVSVHVDGRPENENMIGKTELAHMRTGACLLNLSRGHVVDLEALARALEHKQLSGAAVDVYPKEPRSSGESHTTPLQGKDNVILTPHVGGSTEEAQENIADFVAGHLGDYLERGATVSSVNFPSLQLPPLAHTHRLIHIHRNQPGLMAAISQLMAERDINIAAQYLQTTESIGYVIMDIDAPYEASHVEALRALPHTIKVRALY